MDASILRPADVLSGFKFKKTVKAIELLKIASSKKLTIVTSESLTGGLILSSLVDIPLYGACKFGGFCVYDTRAKRNMLDIKTKNIYSHQCAKEMACNALIKSGATFAISVTGHSMPVQEFKHIDEVLKLGRVHIGIAILKGDEIVVKSKLIDSCINTPGICDIWKSNIKQEKKIREIDKKMQIDAAYKDGFNFIPLTSLVSEIIRTDIVTHAFDFAIEILSLQCD
jgi:nicotinamide-nucleotide amidase